MCVPARSNAKREAGRVADAAGADASREATARSAPHTARDDIVCDTAETRGRENRGRNQILEPGSLPGLFSRNGRKRSSPSRPRAHHTESRARRTRIEADSRAGGGLETPAKHGGGAARSKGAGYDSIPGGDGVSVTLNRAFDAGQRTKRTPIFGAAMSGPETPARVKKETAKVRSRVRRGEHMTETTSCHGREVSPRRTPAPGSLAIAERFHDGFGTPETPVRVVTLAPRPGSSRRPKRDAADR